MFYPRGSETDPVVARMPRQELERRWGLLRDAMRAGGLDAVVALGFDDSLSGPVRWLCDFGAPAYMKVAIFHAEGPMTVVEHGGMSGWRETDPGSAATPGVGRIGVAAAFKSAAATQLQEARATVKDLQESGARHVGLVRPGTMPHAFVSHIERSMPEVSFIDVTETVDALKAIKSEVELAALRHACAVQDDVFAKMLEVIRPGLREVDVLALAEQEFRLHGAIDGTMASASARIGTATGLRPWRAQNRVLQKGDCLTLLLEMSSAEGLYTEMARQVVLGTISEQQRSALAVVREAQDRTVAAMVPGAVPADLAAANDGFLERHGYPPEPRLFAHGQGYDMVERPLVRSDETMILAADMFMACHPAVATPELFVFLCDNFIVRESGPAERCHRTAREIFEV